MNIILLLIGVILLILIIVVLIMVLRKPYKTTGPLVFIHIPKNAGTTITAIGRKHGFQWVYRSDNTSCSPWHIPPDKEIDKPSFCVVRNPYDRMISEYSYSKSKKDLNVFIDSKLKRYTGNKHISNCHFIPQYKYVKYAKHILRFENLTEEFNLLMKKYELDITLDQRKNVTPHKHTIEDISRENLDLINHVYEKDFQKLDYSMK